MAGGAPSCLLCLPFPAGRRHSTRRRRGPCAPPSLPQMSSRCASVERCDDERRGCCAARGSAASRLCETAAPPTLGLFGTEVWSATPPSNCQVRCGALPTTGLLQNESGPRRSLVRRCCVGDAAAHSCCSGQRSPSSPRCLCLAASAWQAQRAGSVISAGPAAQQTAKVSFPPSPGNAASLVPDA